MTAQSLVNLERRPNGVAVLTLSNPPLNLNTLGSIRQINEHCRALAADGSVRVVVVTGDGDRAFCAGSDINEFASVRNDVVSKKLAAENRAFTAIEELPQPVIAALNGVTLGGGAEIALACDLRIIDETARIGFPEVKLGVFPGSGGVFRLPRVVGEGAARRLLFTGQMIDASEAFRIQLVDEIAPAGKSVERALELAAELANGPSLALALIKEGLAGARYENTREATERTLAASHQVFRGPDIEEGIAAFFERRPPQFTAARNETPGKDEGR
ncbi:enoyl-CoA hydratase/isomerase family protein [Microbacterium sp. NPDC058389]|uniref:enoyl-CoA hydratase/isomerase family protein n=1 Tax=Microbacterium sp. NPDC058389 TaxID=3346475 RepID=UPI0036691A43